MNIKKVLVSQPKPSSEKSPYYELADKFGLDIVFRPFIKVEGLTAREFRHQKVSIPEYTAVIFKAKTAVDNFFRLCEEMRLTMPDTMKYFCTSESIALYLQKYIIFRKRKIFAAQTGKLEDLMPYILKHKKENFLLAVADVGNSADSALLDKAKIKHTRAVMYRTVSNDFTPDEAFNYDMLVFFSPQGIESLMKNFPNFNQGDIAVATFGVNTAKAAREANLRIDIEAPSPQTPSMPAAIDQFLSSVRSEQAV